MIIAVDFDGTLCEHKFPNIGAANERLIKNLRLLRSFGHQLILWTCRNQYYANLAVEWCKRSGLEFDAVNDDVPAIKQSAFGRDKSGKVYADIYIDDRNVDDKRLELLAGVNLDEQLLNAALRLRSAAERPCYGLPPVACADIKAVVEFVEKMLGSLVYDR